MNDFQQTFLFLNTTNRNFVKFTLEFCVSTVKRFVSFNINALIWKRALNEHVNSTTENEWNAVFNCAFEN